MKTQCECPGELLAAKVFLPDDVYVVIQMSLKVRAGLQFLSVWGPLLYANKSLALTDALAIL